MKWTIPIVMALVLTSGVALAHGKGPAQDPDDQKSWSFSWSTARGKLGVQLTSMTKELRRYFGAPSDAGVLVSRVQPKSAAADAGLRVGDVVYKVDGVKVDSPMDVVSELQGKRKGDRVKLGVVRHKRRIRLTARLKEEVSGPLDLHMSFGWGDEFFKDPWKWHKEWEWKWPKDPPRLDRDRRLEERMRRLERQLEEMKKRMRKKRRQKPKKRMGKPTTRTRI